MASSTRTAQQWEAGAREFWDKAGRTCEVTDSAHKANLIVASNGLAEAVAALLAQAGVAAEVLNARHVAGMPDGTRYLTVRVTHGATSVLLPLIPEDPAVRLYPGDTEGDLGQPDQVHPVTPGPDRWVSADAIAKQLLTKVAGEESS
ncbi:hypothetical protein [Lentzea sp. CA-135723]|uniref:hypothetical protein n=1 Tax=Lentzea sp. CA-135723 TaxID=3239950 RepID=UPI003D92F50F